jgi:hypothetical protein
MTPTRGRELDLGTEGKGAAPKGESVNNLDAYPSGSRMTLREHIEDVLTISRIVLEEYVETQEEGVLWIGHRIEPSGMQTAEMHWVPDRCCETCGSALTDDEQTGLS